MATVTRDAKHRHIRYIDYGNIVEAVVGGNPANDGTDKDYLDGREIIASITRIYARESGFWGYTLTHKHTHYALQNVTKPEAMKYLRDAVAEIAHRYRDYREV